MDNWILPTLSALMASYYISAFTETLPVFRHSGERGRCHSAFSHKSRVRCGPETSMSGTPPLMLSGRNGLLPDASWCRSVLRALWIQNVTQCMVRWNGTLWNNGRSSPAMQAGVVCGYVVRQHSSCVWNCSESNCDAFVRSTTPSRARQPMNLPGIKEIDIPSFVSKPGWVRSLPVSCD